MRDDPRYMARAIELARRGLYSTHPNPRVGCVLVKDGAVVGEGTSGTGLEHAMQCLEVMVSDQWVMARLDKKKPRIDVTTPDEGDAIHTNRDPVRGEAEAVEG